MKLIVALGNPGRAYVKTRHNVGFLICDNYLGNIKWQKKFNSLYYETNLNDEKIIFIKPQTYMNLSGTSVVEWVNFYKIESKDILIIHDDIDLLFNTLRIKINSSSGGHNGIKSIIDCLNCTNFYRLKIGILNEHKDDAAQFVTEKFSKNELSILLANQEIYNKIIDYFLHNNIDVAMNIYN